MSKAQFVPVDLSALASPIPESASWHLVIGNAIASLPRGREVAWGVPFDFIGTADGGPFVSIGEGAARSLVIPFASQPVSHALFAHFTVPRPDSADWGAPDGRPNGMPTGTGDVVAEYELSYGQHDTHRRQIRRRFEINDVLVGWGQLAFAARPHRAIRPLAWRGPHAPGEWGYNQTAAELPDYDSLGADGTRRVVGSYWIYALANPEPGRPVESIRLVSRGSDLVVVGGITLFRGDGDPLRHGRLFTVRVETAPDGGREVPVSIDLG
ncbi:MAG: hypothetical protein M3082_11940, partial [Candidatus Dormibacteraeota bacterium]|nr:hypothetical protein [Candidatus Dormibacteraeota bacterium]